MEEMYSMLGAAATIALIILVCFFKIRVINKKYYTKRNGVWVKKDREV